MTGQQTTDPVPEAVDAVAAAAAQITLALREARQPVEQLAASISRMIVTLSLLRAIAEGRAGTAGDMDLRMRIRAAIDELGRDAAQATITMQFYDRMAQHLTHLHDYLEGIGELLAVPQASTAGWHDLRERLCGRLVSNAQRKCLHGGTRLGYGVDKLLDADRSERSAADSIELF